MKRNQENLAKHYIAGIFAVIFWGTAFAFSKDLVNNPMDPISLTAMRTGIGMVFLLLFVILSGNIQNLISVIKKNYKSFLLRGHFYR